MDTYYSQQPANTIKFTQYLRPNGTRAEQYAPMPTPIEEWQPKVDAIFRAGLRFEAEVLTTGHVSLTVFDPSVEDDIACQICSNSPAVDDALKRLITSAFKHITPSEDQA